MSVTQDEFDEIEAEYAAAREAWWAAEERLKAAGRALTAAQCGESLGTRPSTAPGYVRRIICTLHAGHEGEHVNKAEAAKSDLLVPVD